MTRITNNLKDKIVQSAIAKTSHAEGMASLREDEYRLAEDIRIWSLGGPEGAARIEKVAKELEGLASSVPEGLRCGSFELRRDYEMYRLNLGGMRANLKFSNDASDERICASGVTLAGDHPLTLRFNEIINRESEIEQRRTTLENQVRAVLNTCSTVKKLLTLWPEAKDLLPALLEESRPQLPAVQTSELNAVIGLPTDSAN